MSKDFWRPTSLGNLCVPPPPGRRPSFTSGSATNTTVGVYDLTGKLVTTLNYDAAKGMNVVRLDVLNLATGIYVVAITSDELNVTGKFIKQ